MKGVWIFRLGILLILFTGAAPLLIDRMPSLQILSYGAVYALVCLGFLGIRTMRRFPRLMIATLASEMVVILCLYLLMHLQRATMLFAPVTVFAFLGFYREEGALGARREGPGGKRNITS